MAGPNVTYTFANSTTADAVQVNQNFTDLINGATDGTKDYTINALTANSTANLKAGVILGAGTPNDITWNGSLASTLNIKTNNSFDIGNDAFGLRALYLGSGSSAHSTKVAGASVSAAWTLTLPNGVPTVSNAKIICDTAGTTSFIPASALPGVTASKTTTYAATSSDDLVRCDSSSAGFTVTLPAANAFTGKVIRILKTDTSLNAVTVSRAGADTINGATSTTLNTQYEIITLISDGSSAWYILDRDYPKTWVAYTPAFVGFGTVAGVTFASRRVGDTLEVIGQFQAGTVTASTATMTLGYGGTSANVSTDSSVTANTVLGPATGSGASTTFFGIYIIAPGLSGTTVNFAVQTSTAAALTAQPGNVVIGSNGFISLKFAVKISGWN